MKSFHIRAVICALFYKEACPSLKATFYVCLASSTEDHSLELLFRMFKWKSFLDGARFLVFSSCEGFAQALQ